MTTRSPAALPPWRSIRIGTATPPIETSRPSWVAITGFLAAATVAALGYALTASYARKETARGLLVPAAGTVRVLPPRSGIVTHLAVSAGQRVAAGDPLFTIDSRHGLAAGGTLDTALRDALDRQAAMLDEQVRAEEQRAATEDQRLAAQIAGLERELTALASQREIQAERAEMARRRFEALTELRAKGHVSDVEYRSREEAWLAHRQSLAALGQQIAVAENGLAQARLSRAQLPAITADRLAQLRAASAELGQRRAEIEAGSAVVVRAPIAGRVSALQAHFGQIADPARPALILVPEPFDLRAELFVPGRAIGFVRAGQRVRLMYDAYPYQRFGTYGGTVQSVSDTVFAPSDVMGPVSLGEPAYRVTVRLDRPDVDAFGRAVPLHPDMTVNADILLEERTVFDWLLEPLYSARGRM